MHPLVSVQPSDFSTCMVIMFVTDEAVQMLEDIAYGSTGDNGVDPVAALPVHLIVDDDTGMCYGRAGFKGANLRLPNCNTNDRMVGGVC